LSLICRNPHGYLQPVYVLVDMKADDEGRAMLQTVHALAPSAGLCFATGYGPTGVEGLAQRILQLAEPPCNADIILDDVSFFDNPYVDGPAARAVESVVSKHNVLYVSAAGNRRFFTREFAAEFVTAAHVEQKHLRRITSILSWTRFPDDMAPTWEGFGAPIRTGPKFLKLYLWWNQPATHMVDDLNLYIFAPNGTLLSQSTDANLISGQAQEVVFVPAGAEPLIAAVGLAAHRDTDSTSRGQNTPSLRLYFRVTNTYYTKVWPKSAKLHPAIWGHSAAKYLLYWPNTTYDLWGAQRYLGLKSANAFSRPRAKASQSVQIEDCLAARSDPHGRGWMTTFFLKFNPSVRMIETSGQ